MSEDMKKTLEEYLTKLLSAAENGVTWTAEQIPFIIQEKLTFDWYVALIWFIIGLSVFSAALIFGPKWHRTYNEICREGGQRYHNDEEEKYIFGTIASCFAGVISIPIMIYNVMTMVKIAVAPRLYIIDWLKDMVMR